MSILGTSRGRGGAGGRLESDVFEITELNKDQRVFTLSRYSASQKVVLFWNGPGVHPDDYTFSDNSIITLTADFPLKAKDYLYVVYPV